MNMPMIIKQELLKKILAFRLKEYIKKHNLTQKEFAALVGMLPQQLSFYIQEKRGLSETNHIKIAQEMGLSNKWELYRMPEGMAPKPIEEAWNAFIDLINLSPEEVSKVKDYIDLLLSAQKTTLPSKK
jgi:transcriptional regulator with XRE-family HTH domain